MTVRDAIPEDFPAIEQIHAKMNIDYILPDLGQPLFFVRKVTTDTDGRVVGACFLRLAAETYLWLDPDLSPKAKVETMQEMQPEVFREAWSKGIDDVEARIPGDLERRFQKRLKQLGWLPNRSDWHAWSAKTA